MDTNPGKCTSTPQWLTLTQAAQVAGVSRATICRWAQSGILPKSATLSVGRTRVRYARTWLEGSRVEGVAS